MKEYDKNGKVIKLPSCGDDDSGMLQIPTQKKIRVILQHGELSNIAEYACLLWRAHEYGMIILLNEHISMFRFVYKNQDVVANSYLSMFKPILLNHYVLGIQYATVLDLEGLI